MVIASDNAPRCPLPMPWGWFQVLYSHDLAVGESNPCVILIRNWSSFAPRAVPSKYWMHIAHIWVHTLATESVIRRVEARV